MANRKLPLAKVRLTGALTKNPQRYRGLSEPQITEPTDHRTHRSAPVLAASPGQGRLARLLRPSAVAHGF